MLKCKKQKNPRISKTEKLGFYELCKFGKSVTVHEVMNYLVITDVPCKVFLKYAVSECVAEFVDDSVETGFGGVRLPTAVKDTHELITDLSDLVIVQVHSRYTVVVVNSGVAHAPIGVVFDGGVHEHFNLTHVLLGSVGESVSVVSGVGECKDGADLANNLGGQLNALCFNEVAAHLKVGLHLVNEIVELDGVCESEHGRFVWYFHNIGHVGREVNTQWTLRQVSPLTADTQIGETRLSQHVHPLVRESVKLLVHVLGVAYLLSEHQLVTAFGSDGDAVGALHVNS